MDTKIILTILLCCFFEIAYSSAVTFTSSPVTIKAPLTDKVTIRCGLSDTSQPAVSVIGRSLTDHPANRDTQPGSDVQFVTSIVISRAGSDVAAMTEHLQATAFGNDSNIAVSGDLSGGQGERGFLQAELQYPSKQQAGEYKCDVSGVNSQGHNFDFSETIEILSEDITLSDLISQVSALKQQNSALSSQLTRVQQQVDTHVFFSVAISKHADVPAHQALVYDKIYSNVGGGYTPASGEFVCPVAGYYHFEISALSERDSVFRLSLQVNGNAKISIYGTPTFDFQGSSNSVTLRLNKADTVKVVATMHSVFYDDSTHDYCTFSGTLVSQG